MAERAPGTGQRRTSERGPIPGRAAIRPAGESSGSRSRPLAAQTGQAVVVWASSGAGPVPLATARATAPHSGQTALRHFARAPQLRWVPLRTPWSLSRPISLSFPTLLLETSPTPPQSTASLLEINLFQKRPLPVSPETTTLRKLRETPAHCNQSVYWTYCGEHPGDPCSSGRSQAKEEDG